MAVKSPGAGHTRLLDVKSGTKEGASPGAASVTGPLAEYVAPRASLLLVVGGRDTRQFVWDRLPAC